MRKFFANLKPLFFRHTSDAHVKLGELLINKNLHAATAESCTGGLISSRLTDISGSSAYTKENFVTYSYDSKEEILGVKHETLIKNGAVSYECAYEMAQGLHNKTGCNLAICTTGIAGPTVDEGKPAGLIFIAIYYRQKITVREVRLNHLINRKNMKFMFSEIAIKLATEILSG